MRNNEFWVLVASDFDGATLFANAEGSSRLIKRFEMPSAAAPMASDPNGVRLSSASRPTAILARAIMEVLTEGVSCDEFDGLLIVASPQMSRDLRLAMDQRVYARAITKILDAPSRTAADRRAETAPHAAIRSAVAC